MRLAIPRYNRKGFRRELLNFAIRFAIPFDSFAARRKQRKFVGAYVGVTGSCGKTTTTTLVAAVLSDQASVKHEMLGNIGTRVTRPVRKLTAPVDFVVQEVSAHRPGALDSVLGLSIDVAVVTTVGLDHAAFFRTREAVAAEKGRLVEGVPPTGLAVLNADDDLVRAMASLSRGRVILYGRAADAEVRAENAIAPFPDRMSFDLVIGETRRRVATRFPGTLMLPNVLATLAVVHGRGLDIDRAVARLATVEPYEERLEVVAGPYGHSYVLDTHKAPLWSTQLMVDDLGSWGPMRRILVLGEISDILSNPSRQYRRVLRAGRKACDVVIAVDRAADAAEHLRKAGELDAIPARSLDAVRAILAEQPPSLVILKGNNKSRLRNLVAPVAATVAAA